MMDNLVPCNSIFSNGTEYEVFLETQCFRCTRFRNWHCRIVNACEKARWDEKYFPYDDLLEWERYAGKRCKSFTTEPIKREPHLSVPMEHQIQIDEMEKM